jgi:formylglycine-generating enzyme required for sulfatase activity/CubicO group peptidase (beta-lactamase class C family)/tRNA A-37 threonylcarbamoyl transferase component Bud32
MDPMPSCPSVEQLARFLRQELPAEETGPLARHVGQCVLCAAQIRALRQEAPSSAVTVGPTVGAAVPSATAQRPQVEATDTPTRELTSPLSGAEEARLPEVGPLDFLAPAQGPGELGRLGDYRILRVLGCGGMGIVFEAEDVQLKRRVALKAMRPAIAGNAEARQRFLREARAVAALDNDHIVHVYQVGADRGIPFMAMQLLRGQTLADRLKRETWLSGPEILRLGREIADGLAAAHAQGLIHRDIKPSNIWLESRGEPASTYWFRVKILDFGLARAAEGDVQISQSGLVAGTPQYMAPEQAEGGKVDARSDLFALGCVLYRAATGRVPFSGTSVLAVLRSLAIEQPPAPRSVNPAIPPELSNLIERLLAKAPQERPASAREVADLLADLEHGTDTGTGSRTALHQPSAAPPGRAAVRGRWRHLLMAAGLSIAALGVLLFWMFHSGDDPDRTDAGNSAPEGEPPPAIVPFTAEQAADLQRRWARYLGRVVHETNSVKMDLVLLPPGRFTMGTSAEEIAALEPELPKNEPAIRNLLHAEAPPHLVAIRRPFYLGKYEVTVAQFRAFARATGYITEAERDHDRLTWRQPGWKVQDDEPVVCVTWNDATTFCRWLCDTEGKSYRLPTEGEWEYACRAGTTTRTCYGDTLSAAQANIHGPHPLQAESGPTPDRVARVGSYAPNAFGLYDLHGNVWEWCADWFRERAYGSSAELDPAGPPFGNMRVMRGGSWTSWGIEARSATRADNWPFHRWPNRGFRILCQLEPAPASTSSAEPLLVDASLADYHVWLERLRVKGYRPTLVSALTVQGRVSVTAAAVPNVPAIGWEARDDTGAAGYQETFVGLNKHGYRPIAVTGYRQGDSTPLLSLFVRDGLRDWGAQHDLPSASLPDLTIKYRAARMRPAFVSAYGAADDPRLATVFIPAEGIPWQSYEGQSGDQLHKSFVQLARLGFRPISVTAAAGKPRFTSVWVHEPTPWYLLVGRTADELRADAAEKAAKGYRLSALAAYSEDQLRFVVAWVLDRPPAVPPPTDLPVSGWAAPGLEEFDRTMLQFMLARGIGAGALAVLNGKRLVLERGYGHSDREAKLPLPANAPFRLASLSKPITRGAINVLVAQGKLGYDTPLLDVLPIVPPPGRKRDERWKKITIRHLIVHQGGWDDRVTFDPMFRSLEIARSLGKPGPASADDIITFMAGEPLQFDPGTKTVYSNFGFCLLGRVIEKVSGRPYVDFVREQLAAPVRAKVELAHSLPGDRNPREPFYWDPGTGRNVIQPESTDPVPLPDGGFAIEAMEAHGGLLASAADYARLFRRAGPKAGEATYYGSLPGTFTLVRRRANGVVMVALFNQRTSAEGLSFMHIRQLLDRVADQVKEWPK